jgi:predicted ATPase
MLVVISGGPGAGKTTLLGELERRGFSYVAEVARQIIQEQMREGGDALPWGDRARYGELMLERSIASYQEYSPREFASTKVTFFDRGIPDSLCYARLVGLPEGKIVEACRKYRYARRVFLAPPWREIYAMDAERKQSYDEAVKTYEGMARVYEDCGYEVVEIPRVTAEERADFILSMLAK